MVHTEEGTKGNLHSGHMVYMLALVEVGRGQGVCTGVRQPETPTSGPGRTVRASEAMGTRPLRWTSGHSRQERQTSKGKTQAHSS